MKVVYKRVAIPTTYMFAILVMILFLVQDQKELHKLWNFLDSLILIYMICYFCDQVLEKSNKVFKKVAIPMSIFIIILRSISFTFVQSDSINIVFIMCDLVLINLSCFNCLIAVRGISI